MKLKDSLRMPLGIVKLYFPCAVREHFISIFGTSTEKLRRMAAAAAAE